MRYFILSVITVLISVIFIPASAQSFASFSEVSITLKSDSTTKSVLMSNLLQNRAGDLSPIIGSATWIDNGRRLQCRSLIAFDYGILPKMISPESITKAQLILIPLQLKDQADENNSQTLRLSVRRVLQQWNDSTTTWENQPVSNSEDEVVVQANRKKKDPAIKINVTEMVKNMFRFGNNGFLLCYADSLHATTGSSHWYASAKYEIEKARPLLLISYSVPVRTDYNQNIPPLPLTARDRNELMQMYIRPEPVIVTPPPTAEPTKTKENN